MRVHSCAQNYAKTGKSLTRRIFGQPTSTRFAIWSSKRCALLCPWFNDPCGAHDLDGSVFFVRHEMSSHETSDKESSWMHGRRDLFECVVVSLQAPGIANRQDSTDRTFPLAPVHNVRRRRHDAVMLWRIVWWVFVVSAGRAQHAQPSQSRPSHVFTDLRRFEIRIKRWTKWLGRTKNGYRKSADEKFQDPFKRFIELRGRNLEDLSSHRSQRSQVRNNAANIAGAACHYIQEVTSDEKAWQQVAADNEPNTFRYPQ